MRLEGSLINRLSENKNFAEDGIIRVGMGVTHYLYTDRHAYEVVEVQDQKHITIRKMRAERVDNNGASEDQEYKLTSDPTEPVDKLTYRNGCWMREEEFSKAMWLEMARNSNMFRTPEIGYNYYRAMARLTEKQLQKLEEGKVVKKYYKFGNISFGRAEQYYDYSF